MTGDRRITHPFRPQTPSEAEAAITILEREVSISARATYEEVMVEDVSRGWFSRYPFGGSTEQEAVVVVRDSGTRYRATVSVTDETVRSFGRFPAETVTGDAASEPKQTDPDAVSTEVMCYGR